METNLTHGRETNLPERDNFYSRCETADYVCHLCTSLSDTLCIASPLLRSDWCGDWGVQSSTQKRCTCFLIGGAASAQLLNSRHQLETSGYKDVALFCKGLPSGRDCSTL